MLHELTYMWNLKKYNELVNYSKKKKKESDTDTENKLLVTTGEKEGEGQWGERGYYKII